MAVAGTSRVLNDLLDLFGIGSTPPSNEKLRDVLTSQKQAAKFTTAALAPASTAAAGDLTGAASVVFNNSANNPGNYTTRTAAQMIADHVMQPGDSYELRIVNGQGVGVLTLVAGAGVTPSGTMTIAINTWRDFVVTCTAAGAITIQSIATGTFS